MMMNGAGSRGAAGRGAGADWRLRDKHWSSLSVGPGSADPAVEVAVADADLKDVRVTVRRQTPQ